MKPISIVHISVGVDDFIAVLLLKHKHKPQEHTLQQINIRH